MNELVFLLEEPSIIEVLRVLVPGLVPDHVICRFVPHEGKSDLERSIPRKLRAWRTPGVRFVVVRDKDQGDCHVVKDKLLELCRKAGRPDTLVRIVCHHLEALRSHYSGISQRWPEIAPSLSLCVTLGRIVREFRCRQGPLVFSRHRKPVPLPGLCRIRSPFFATSVWSMKYGKLGIQDFSVRSSVIAFARYRKAKPAIIFATVWQ